MSKLWALVFLFGCTLDDKHVYECSVSIYCAGLPYTLTASACRSAQDDAENAFLTYAQETVDMTNCEYVGDDVSCKATEVCINE